jgi:predicted nucleic acid-binding protein
VIAYVDSSVLARAYFADEAGHDAASALLDDTEVALVTGTWSRIEVSGAIVRACRTGRGDAAALLDLLDADLSVDGPVTVVAADQHDIESRALDLVRNHGIRAMDAWHLAVAAITLPTLAEPAEQQAFATRDQARGEVAATLGLTVI